MDSGQAMSSGDERARQQAPIAIGSADAKRKAGRKPASGDRRESVGSAREPAVSGREYVGSEREAASSTFDAGLIDAAGREGIERTAAVLAGAGKDVATAQERRKMLGELPELPADRYLDREESWLRFAQRVLELAEDPNVPLLERVRFESIFASALDEFFMVRVAGRIRRMATGLPVESVSGKAPDQILENTLGHGA